MNLNKEQFEIFKKGLKVGSEGNFKVTGQRFTDLLTTAGLSETVLSNDDLTEYSYDSELFKGGNDTAAFLVYYPHFRVGGRLHASSERKDGVAGQIMVDEIWLRRRGSKLTLDEMLTFANTFHRADEFEVREHSARAWWD